MFNLISSPWLPVRRLSGAREWIAPAAITSRFDDDPILALDFPRPDWNAAVTELLIGLLAVVAAPRSTDAWADRWATPFTPDELSERLARIAFAFDLDGDGPRAFQDLDAPSDKWSERPIEWLLLASPVENTNKLNKDLFAKRGTVSCLSLPYAAAALVTLQTYAPEGGPGFRTSIRGGGPLSTIAAPRRRFAEDEAASTLWDVVWSNVPASIWYDEFPDLYLEKPDLKWGRLFPWLTKTRTSEKDNLTTLDHVHPLQCFFGMPCRIKLIISPLQQCSIGGETAWGSSSAWLTRAYGVMYEGFLHPLSPYRLTATGQKRPFHYRRGLGFYREWFSWGNVAANKEMERARCLTEWERRITALQHLRDVLVTAWPLGDHSQTQVHCWGFDFKQNTALAWLDARLPFYVAPATVAPDDWAREFRTTALRLVEGAKVASSALHRQVLKAVFGKWDAGKKKWRVDAPGQPFDDLLDRLWRETEPAFRAALAELRCAPADLDRRVRRDFLGVLRRTALRLFDEAAGTDNLADMNARRIVEARGKLVSAFSEAGPVARSLDIVTEEARQKKAARSKGGKREAA